MEQETPPPFDPYSKSDIEKRAEILAEKQGFSKDSPEEDAFRHAYTAAMMTKYHIGDILTQGGGYLVEAGGLAKNFMHAIVSIFDSDYKAPSWSAVQSEMYKDLHNNKQGIDIGNTAKDEEDIISKVAEQIKDGAIITDPGESYDRYNKEFGAHSMNLVAGDGMWEGGLGSAAAGFDPSALIQALGGRRGGTLRDDLTIAICMRRAV